MKHVTGKKERDRAVIEALVRKYGPISRAEIRELTHLRWSVISPIVRELLSEQKLLEVGPSSNPMGRKQTLLRLNEDHGFILGVTFDPETVSAAVTSLLPRIMTKVIETTCLDRGVEGLVRQLFSCGHQAIQQAGIQREKLLGTGVADPGMVNAREGISILSANLGFWRDVPLRELFEEEFGKPVILEGSTRAQTLAERVLGAGKGAKDMIYIEYGKGIGAGITIEGRPFYGHDGIAGEFGHIPMIENGPACNCGSFGCLEALVGLSAIDARCRKAIQDGSNSCALEIANGDPGKITGWTVLEASKVGDKTCVAIVEELAKYLGLGLSTLVNLFNPSIVVLDYRLGLGGESLLDQIARIVRKQALGNATANLEFACGTLGSDAGILGAALNVLESIFEIPALKPPRFMVEGSAIDALAANRRAWSEDSSLQPFAPNPLS
jgi:predicted NBD/HSP70 family sugar kinase